MATKTDEMDHLEYVRQRLADMPKGDRPRLAVEAGLSLTTIYNIKKGGRDVKYGNVMTLYRAFKDAEKPKRKPKGSP